MGSGWDGNYNGTLMPATDYWFIVKYKENNLNILFASQAKSLKWSISVGLNISDVPESSTSVYKLRWNIYNLMEGHLK